MKKNKFAAFLKKAFPWLALMALAVAALFSLDFSNPNVAKSAAQTAQLKHGLEAAGIAVQVVQPPVPQSLFLQFFFSWGPTLLLIGAMLFMMTRSSSAAKGGGMGGSFAKSRAKELSRAEGVTLFADVAGCDEAKEEVSELVDFLRSPEKFKKLGGNIPAGVMLSGPPGTGKTLLAKAIAGEAGVPFFSISGSDFVEMFVGVGAARVRDLFETAKKNAPCIIFIDEIDAVGRHRGAGMGGGNDEREQTLNQMLVEMDGFGGSSGVIVIAATNRPDVLDPALLRPGRFDRQVTVGLPDVLGREQILRVHLRKLPLSLDVSPEILARGTPGFSGADLQNLTNEAALFAARSNKTHVDMADFEHAKDKLLMGVERRSVRMPESERLSTAYHEAGHAVIAKLMAHADPVHKVSIVPRGRALGVTLQMPEGDRYSLGKKRILDTIAILFGGRIAEELFTDDVTTGASNDYERANAMARNLVSRWGMSEVLGPLVVGDTETEPFLGRSIQRQSAVSEDTMQKIDGEVRRILEEQYARVQGLLKEHAREVEVMTQALMKWETIDADQVNDVMAGREPRAPKGYVPRPVVTDTASPAPVAQPQPVTA